MLLANVTHCQRKQKSWMTQKDIKSPQQPGAVEGCNNPESRINQ